MKSTPKMKSTPIDVSQSPSLTGNQSAGQPPRDPHAHGGTPIASSHLSYPAQGSTQPSGTVPMKKK
jgi:hypothetical protein